jgi:hypothetical protein
MVGGSKTGSGNATLFDKVSRQDGENEITGLWPQSSRAAVALRIAPTKEVRATQGSSVPFTWASSVRAMSAESEGQ